MHMMWKVLKISLSICLFVSIFVFTLYIQLSVNVSGITCLLLSVDLFMGWILYNPNIIVHMFCLLTFYHNHGWIHTLS